MTMKCDCQADCDDGSDESVTWASCLANTTSCNHAPGKVIVRKAFQLYIYPYMYILYISRFNN